MRKILYSFVLSLFFILGVQAVSYPLTTQPIDVIIPSTEKDLATLDLCIDGIRNNCSQVRRIIVISDKPLTEKAEWFDERNYPFSKEDIAYFLVGCEEEKASAYLASPKCRVGWYFQQLLKLYAPYVIPGLSSNVLHLDSDTIFLNPVSFVEGDGSGLYNVGSEHHPPYFSHMDRLIPGLKKVFPDFSGICHHMLLQRPVLDDLFETVETYHNTEFWQAFCYVVNEGDLYGSGASENEIYFNFVFTKTAQVKLRPLKWANVKSLSDMKKYRKKGYHYISCHSWMR